MTLHDAKILLSRLLDRAPGGEALVIGRPGGGLVHLVTGAGDGPASLKAAEKRGVPVFEPR
jgi:antitoxin (DNA-binding transcriptional repressor) of toxin-antitoxin stability system